MSWLLRLLTLSAFVLISFSANPALAERRVALVIGNGNYQFVEKLPNPTRDADAMSAVLRELRFDVLTGKDLDRQGMVDIVTRFDDMASDADVALIFFAGHAVQIDGQNYLLPVSINADLQRQVTLGSIRLTDVYESVAGKVDTSILLVDACRDNPFRQRGLRGTGTVSRGLAQINAKSARNGSFIGFATAPDEKASDGVGLNSPYTAAILENIRTPDVDIDQLMRRVGERVRAMTNGQQVPWVQSSLLTKGFKFNPLGAPSVPNPVPPVVAGQCEPAGVDIQFWNAVKDTGNEQLLRRYLELCPNGIFVDEAAKKIASLPIPPIDRPGPEAPVPGWYLAEYAGLDFWGGDLTEKGERSENADACARLCGQSLQCKLYSYSARNKTCYLKNRLDIPVIYPGIESGFYFLVDSASSPQALSPPEIRARFRAYPHEAHIGGALPTYQPDRRVAKIDDCLRFCDGSYDCSYITFDATRPSKDSCLVRKLLTFGKKDKMEATAFDKVNMEVAPAELRHLPELTAIRGQ